MVVSPTVSLINPVFTLIPDPETVTGCHSVSSVPSLPAKQVSPSHPPPPCPFFRWLTPSPWSLWAFPGPACLPWHLLAPASLPLPLLHTLSPWACARSCKCSRPRSCSAAASRCHSSGHTVLAWLPRYPEALPTVKHCCCRKTEKSADLVRHPGILKEEMKFYSKVLKEISKQTSF